MRSLGKNQFNRVMHGCWAMSVHECRLKNRFHSLLSATFRKLGKYINFTVSVSFGRNTRSRWFRLSGVYARGRKSSQAGV